MTAGYNLRSKDPSIWTNKWPEYYDKAKGLNIWADGVKYEDWATNGIGCCILGYQNKYIDSAVKKAIAYGNMASLNNKYEKEFGKYFLGGVGCGFRCGKTGADATKQAIRIARTHTGRDKVAIMGYHGHDDWYLAGNIENDDLGYYIQNVSPLGVPEVLKDTVSVFKRNDYLMLIELDETYAAVIIEPFRFDEPNIEWLNRLSKTCNSLGILLVYDLITIGVRQKLNFLPPADLYCIGKSVSNGYSFSACVGRKDIMEKAKETFLSSTYWTEAIGIAAACEMQKLLINEPIHDIIQDNGKYFKESLSKVISDYDLGWELEHSNCLIHWEFKDSREREWFINSMIDKGYLAANAYYVTTNHTEKYVDRYMKTLRKILGDRRKAST